MRTGAVVLPQPRKKVVVPAAELSFRLLDGRQAAEDAAELESVRAEVYRDPAATGTGGADSAAGSFLVQRRQPGYVLAEARSGGFLIGHAAGLPLRASTSWWRNLTSALPEDITTEHAGRTFALTELAVRTAWRRQGIGRYLIDLVLADRPEDRATVMIPPAATAAQAAFQNWGWHKVARTRGAGPGSPASDVLLTGLGKNAR